MNTLHCLRCVTPQKCAIFGCCPGTWPAEEGPALCNICRQPLDQPGKPDTQDCGGDCVRCMALSNDPDCMETMREVEPNNPRWFDDLPQDSPEAKTG